MISHHHDNDRESNLLWGARTLRAFQLGQPTDRSNKRCHAVPSARFDFAVCTSTPDLYGPGPLERVGDEWVSRLGEMRQPDSMSMVIPDGSHPTLWISRRSPKIVKATWPAGPE